MIEVESGEKRGLREITEDMSSIIFRCTYTLTEISRNTDEITREKFKKYIERLNAVMTQHDSLAKNFIVSNASREEKIRQGELYVTKIIGLNENLYNDTELWDSLPDHIRAYEWDQSDIDLARQRIKNWSDPNSKDFNDYFTHYQTGELLASEDEIREMIKEQQRGIEKETIGQPKSEIREQLKKLNTELEQFYITVRPSSIISRG